MNLILEKVKGDFRSMILSLPPIRYDPDSFLPPFWREQPAPAEEAACTALAKSPQTLWAAAAHVFLKRSFGTQDAYTSILHLTPQEWDVQKDSLPYLFEKFCAAPERVEGINGALFYGKIQRITPFGLRVMQRLAQSGALPPELQALYLKPSGIADDCREEAAFTVTIAPPQGRGTSLHPLAEAYLLHPLVRGINVSGLTMEECEQSGVICFLAERMRKVCLIVEKAPFGAGLYEKRLSWQR